MTEETIFSKIAAGEMPADIVSQDETVTAFRDINPLAPTHVLIVPNRVIPAMTDVAPEDEPVLGHLLAAAAEIAEGEGLSEGGYRLIVNCGSDGGQEVPHLHVHLLGGRPLGPMLTE
jgi:histidine triad (HIT) family protein